jgi:hypothetical protein
VLSTPYSEAGRNAAVCYLFRSGEGRGQLSTPHMEVGARQLSAPYLAVSRTQLFIPCSEVGMRVAVYFLFRSKEKSSCHL